MANYQNRSLLLALVSGVAGMAGLFIAYGFLGAVTGVVAMCSWAPAWWIFSYFGLALGIPIGGVWVGIKSRRTYLRSKGVIDV